MHEMTGMRENVQRTPPIYQFKILLTEKSSNDGNEIKTENEPNCLTKCFNSKNIDEPEYKG